MDKKKNIIIIAIASVIILFITITSCYHDKRISHIEKYIETKIGKCELVREINTHGGFLGDGDYFIELNCSKLDDTEIKINWKKLPVSEELQKPLELKQCRGDGCKDIYERYNIPNIENGYYYFYDRHSDTTNYRNEELINERSSYNFSVGLYDVDHKTLYFYELDT